MKHRFVLCGNKESMGWWLKITDIEELEEYHSAHNSKYGRAVENILTDKDFGAPTVTHGKHILEMPIAYTIYYRAMNNGLSILDSTMQIHHEVLQNQLKHLQEQGAIYINYKGGWSPTIVGPVYQFVDKEGFEFPNFTEKDIHISKFPGGRHYYAHIGPMQVRDGNTLKWHSYQEAYQHALSCLIKSGAKPSTLAVGI